MNTILQPLGKTGLSASPIGFGAFKIGRNQKIKYPQAYELPDEATVERLLNGLLDLGICYIDTAPAYGLSEERIGRSLAVRRREFVLSTKVGEVFADGVSRYDFSSAGIRTSVARSLRRLRTDVLDLVFVHSSGDDDFVLNETDAVPALEDLRRAGDVRAIGFSGKTVAGARQSLQWADAVMVEYHADDPSHDQVMAEAAARDVAVVIKKGLASGHLPADVAIRFVLSHAAVDTLVVGGLNLEHFRENLRIACEQRAAM